MVLKERDGGTNYGADVDVVLQAGLEALPAGADRLTAAQLPDAQLPAAT